MPASPGDGLNGEFYGSPLIGSALDARAFADAGTPDSTFRSTAVDYPNGPTNVVGDGALLSPFLEVDSPSLSGTDTTLSGSVFRFSGSIAITDAMDIDVGTAGIQVSMTVGSDDGFVLALGGIDALGFLPPRAFADTTGVQTFGGAGMYSVDLVYFENGGVTGVEWSSSIGGGIVPTSVLFTSVPEPGALALVGLALLAASGTRRRCRR